MKLERRLLFSLALLVAAATLASCLVEYRVQSVRGIPGTAGDFIPSPNDELVFLGWVDIEPTPESELAKFHGKISAERGIFCPPKNFLFAGADFRDSLSTFGIGRVDLFAVLCEARATWISCGLK